MSFNGALCQSQTFHVSGEGSLRLLEATFFFKCFSSPDCRISGLFGSGADRFVLV